MNCAVQQYQGAEKAYRRTRPVTNRGAARDILSLFGEAGGFRCQPRPAKKPCTQLIRRKINPSA